ncbi:hypothetical protein RRG08_063725 [Elysia crispata]|uniref:Uncharacterized protein n=1 Tax=Elysia crispata TaxID=231223 RepID=A0AAE0ZVL9_9GAST|nr:hypothetical protein RRG08_063725 [Elysia crispata]
MAEIPRIVLEERSATNNTGQSAVSSGQDIPPTGPDKGSHCKAGTGAKDKRSQYTKSADGKADDSIHREDSDNDGDDERRDSVGLAPSHMPIRSSSDIGLPATSMPNLALSLMSGGVPGGDTHLGVYCSPRASRRSVDLEITAAREDGRAGGAAGVGGDFRYDWSSQYEGLDFNSPGVAITAHNTTASSNNSNTLRVLTSSSRAASALSLTSDCTARSIGLLSNDGDSDSDADASLMSDLGQGQGQQLLPSRDSAAGIKSGGTAQLRRYLSHPEESVATPGSASDVGHARPSVSLINIKSAEASLADPVDTSRTGNDAKTVTTDISQSATAELKNSADDHTNIRGNASPRVKEVTSHSSEHTAPKNKQTDSGKNASPLLKCKVQNSTRSKIPEHVQDTGMASYGGNADTFNTIPPSLQDGSLHARTRRADAEERITFSVGGSGIPSGGERSGQRILSYKCDPNDNSRNGRIRQWLQDMDKLDLSNG